MGTESLCDAHDVETLLRAFPGDGDVRHLRDFALGGSRAARLALERLREEGGDRGVRASAALVIVEMADRAEGR